MIITAELDYGVHENGVFTPTKKLKDVTENFFTQVYKNPSCLLVVNEKKILLQQVYKNLFLQLKEHLQLEVQYLDQLYAGVFTNYISPQFKEPQAVLLVLTKKHNKKELRLLKELEKTNIKVYVICLGLEYLHKAFTTICVQKIKALYWMLFVFLNMSKLYDYSEFSERFVFSTKKYKFKG